MDVMRMKGGSLRVRPVKLSWLIRSGRISSMSPMVLIAEKLGIVWLMMFDEYVYGPTPGIVEVSDLLIRSLKPRSVVDLFGGSGALSKLAIRNGVKNVTYVDIYPEAARLNLADHQDKVEIVESDAFGFLRRGVRCDLLLADPPEELIDETVSAIISLRNIFRKAALIWLGSSEGSRERVKALGDRRMIEVVSAWGDSFAIFWKPGLRSEIMRVKWMLE
ncbi:MAG: RsmD family RNA methyltransferase [Thaumarchaeota archaeon]|nr:RsmD family RNA methyltransferase [Nitrososphaerota archaeon]